MSAEKHEVFGLSGNSHPGRVYWITGLSGAGKTTIGRLFYEAIRKRKPNVVLLDGDVLREVFGNDLGHHREDRMKSAMRNARLCKLLSDQGIDVVCCTISLFHSLHEWNRGNIANYTEIFIDVHLDTVISRDSKGIYKAALNSANTDNVVGLSLPEEKPLNPDITINNDGSKSPQEIVAELAKQLLES